MVTSRNFLIAVFSLFLLCLTQLKLQAAVLKSRNTIVVNSTSDSGSGTLRDAILNASPGDSIIFDTTVFSPTDPDTITLISELPNISQGNLIIDASNEGVVLKRNKNVQELFNGISITSNNNVIRGLQIFGFSNGIALMNNAQNNVIGGNRDIGSNPFGQGNLISKCEVGIVLRNEATSLNTITGNFIGTDFNGTSVLGGQFDGIQVFAAANNLIEGNLIGGFQQYGIYIADNQEGNNIVRENNIGTDFSKTRDIGNGWAGIGIERAGSNIIGPANIITNTRDKGIWIMGVESKGNTIHGNYIGTDVNGLIEMGNWRFGIYIDQSSLNVIGPANIIAYNGWSGIGISGEEAVGNQITQNSVYNNDYRYSLGIELWDGGNTQLSVPSLFDYNIQAGIVNGVTCPNCTIEIFSTEGHQGKIYEGMTTANNKGNFSLNKNNAFILPRLVATATDANGNTSQFSVPSPQGLSNRNLYLQQGNNLLKTGLQPKRSGELKKNRIGSFWDSIEPGSEISGDNQNTLDLGVTYARFSFNANEWGRVFWEWPELSVHPTQDDHVSDLASNGITNNFILTFWDVDNHPDGWYEDGSFSRFQTEEEIQRYLEYVQFIVRHFKDRIQYYEIWNEPDNGGWPVQYIKVPDYIYLVKRVVPVIRQEYPEAKIVVGSNVLKYGKDYLYGIISSDEIMPLVDVISWHPFYGDSPEDENTRDYYYDYPNVVQDIKNTAYAHGFRGEFRADEVGLYANPPDQSIKYAKYEARGIMMHHGMDMAVILGTPPTQYQLPFNTIKNTCTIMAGASTDSIPIEVQTSASDIRSCSFSLDNGDKMFAIWSDNIAVDYDLGVVSTLILPGITNQRITGIDVLIGYEQELVTETQDSNIVIHNFMIKDYPIIIKSSSTQVDIKTEKNPGFELHQNYPNPFNTQTTIRYELNKNAHVSIKIYNIFGQLVETVVNDYKTAGYHSVLWNAINVSSGLYFYRIEACEYTETKKCQFLK
jgi:hypothetical protein